MTDFEQNKYAVFLSSLIVVLLGGIFFPLVIQPDVNLVFVILNMLSGLYLVHNKSRWVKLFFIILLILTTGRLVIQLLGQSFFLERLGEVILVIYFIAIAIVIFRDLIVEKNFTMESVYSVFSGFILISFAFGFILMFQNNIVPDSLNGIDNAALVSEYVYFSFITLLTIGYGDITPSTDVTKQLVVFTSLVGNFYTVFVTAIIVGKLSQSKKKHETA